MQSLWQLLTSVIVVRRGRYLWLWNFVCFFLSGSDPQVVVYQVLIKWKKVCDTLATSRFQMLYENNFYISNCGEKKLKLEFYGEKHSQNLVRRLFCFLGLESMPTSLNQVNETWLTRMHSFFSQSKGFWNFWKRINLTASYAVIFTEKSIYLIKKPLEQKVKCLHNCKIS